MKKLFEKYLEECIENNDDKKNLSLLHEIEVKLAKYENLDLKPNDEEIVFDIVKEITKASNICNDDVITRIFDILKARDITVDDIINLNEDELIELISDEYDDSKDDSLIQLISNEDIDFDSSNYEIIKEFIYNDLNCTFLKDNKGFILICDNDKYIETFKSIEEILCSLLKYKLNK